MVVGDRVIAKRSPLNHLLPKTVRPDERGTVISVDGSVFVRVRFDGHDRDTVLADYHLAVIDLIDKIAELSIRPPQQRIIPPGRT